MTERDETHLLSGAYALDAVHADEAARVEAAMHDSEELRHEVVGLSDTAVALGLAVSPLSPPSALRSRLLEMIEVLPQEEPVEPAEEPDSTRSGAHVAPRRRARRVRLPAALLSAAVAAVLLFSGGFLVQRTLLGPQSDYSRITAAADADTHTSRVAGGGTAEVTSSRSQGGTVVVLHGVAVPAGRVLQLWSVRGSTATSLGLYRPQGDEAYEVLHRLPVSGEKLAVSVETHEAATPSLPTIVTVPLTA